MELKCISIKALAGFLASETFQKMPVIPISERRGLAHSIHPRALPEDIALVLAYLNESMVGYLGFLPDDIYNGKKKLHLAWMSCIWVDPNTRGKGVAKALLKKGFEVWEDKVLATEFTAPAKSLYDKLQLFDDLIINHGLRCYLRFNLAELLPASRPQLKLLKPFLKLSDALLNIFNALRLNFYKKEDLSAEELDHLDSESIDFINRTNKAEFFRRDIKVLHWLLENPWLGNTLKDQEDAKRYHFSVFSDHFRFSILKIKNADEVIAILILAERDRALKTPYCWMLENTESIIVKTIWKYMLRKKLNMLTLYQQTLIPFLKKEKTPFYLKRSFRRHYLISKKIDKQYLPDSILIQDGDGDCAFT